MSGKVGPNAQSEKRLFKLSYPPKVKSDLMDFIYALSTNQSHRWIPFQMVYSLDHILVTERQADWLKAMVHSRLKVTEFDLETVQTNYQS